MAALDALKANKSKHPAHRLHAISLLSVLLLTSCTSKAEQAKAEYQMAERYGAGDTELCERARAVAEALLEEQNTDEYPMANIDAGLKCSKARLEGYDDRL